MAEPGFWMVMVCVLVTPTVTVPKLTLAGTTEMSGCTPVPLSEIVASELVAVLATTMVPVTGPVAAGAKRVASEKLWPGVRVTAPEKPRTLNPAPVEVT